MDQNDTARELLALNMKRLRAVVGISQMVLAQRVGCSTTLIGNIEIKKRFPSAENLDRIAGAFGVPVYELFMRDSPAIDRVASNYEVKETIERKVLEAIHGVLDERGFYYE